MIVDLLTAPRGQLLSMLEPTRAFAHTPPDYHQQQTGAKSEAGTSTSQGDQAGSTAGSMSLSELSVSDPGMKEPEAWWSQVQTVLSAIFRIQGLRTSSIACEDYACFCDVDVSGMLSCLHPHGLRCAAETEVSDHAACNRSQVKEHATLVVKMCALDQPHVGCVFHHLPCLQDSTFLQHRSAGSANMWFRGSDHTATNTKLFQCTHCFWQDSMLLQQCSIIQ